jgi:hypothetical protein
VHRKTPVSSVRAVPAIATTQPIAGGAPDAYQEYALACRRPLQMDGRDARWMSAGGLSMMGAHLVLAQCAVA